MQQLNPHERVIRACLIHHVALATHLGPADEEHSVLITYEGLGNKLKAEGHDWVYPGLTKPFRGIGEALGHISTYEYHLGRPLLSAVVVSAVTGFPGRGFIEALLPELGIAIPEDPKGWVTEEQNRLFDFWHSDDDTRFLDAAMGSLMQQIERLRRDLRKHMEG